MSRNLRQLTAVDLQVLRAVNRFRYLTAAQLNRVLWPDNTKDENRYAQRRLKVLVSDEYLLPLRELPRPATGTAPRVYALGWRGRKGLLALGDIVPSYYRPSEVAEAARNAIYMPHTLAVVDVLIAVERLTRDIPAVQLQQLLLERDLRRLHLTVTVPSTRNRPQPHRVTVVPDALFTLVVEGTEQHFLLELDRGTERQGVWQDKITAEVLWVASEGSNHLLTSPYVTIMVVTSTQLRRQYLQAWTGWELHTRGLLAAHGHFVAITACSPVRVNPLEFLTGKQWHPPYTGPPDSLIDLPES